jgi:hypothetical protein
MDIALHAAAAALACNVTLYLEHQAAPEHVAPLKTGAAGLLLSLGSHLWLDAIPHVNVLYKLDDHLGIIGALIFLLIAGLVGLFALYLTRDRPVLILLSLCAGAYPDFEKAAYLGGFLPKTLVVFRRHSCTFSADVEYRQLLSTMEIVLFIAILAATYWCAAHRHPQLLEDPRIWIRRIWPAKMTTLLLKRQGG